MFGGFIIIHKYREANNWLINIYELGHLHIGANVYTLPLLEPLRCTHTASCWSVSTVVMCKKNIHK